MDYIVEVKDVFKNVYLVYETFDNANTAYHYKRMLDDQYADVDPQQIVIKLIEPE